MIVFSDKSRRELTDEDFKLPEDISLEEIRGALRKIMHLDAVISPPELVTDLLNCFPNITTMSFENRKATLGLRRLGPKLYWTKFDLTSAFVHDVYVVAIIEGHCERLQVLQLQCKKLTVHTHRKLSECSDLQHLTLREARYFQDDHLRAIVQKNPNLEVLELETCGALTDEGLSHVHRLNKLRELTLCRCHGATKEFFCSLGKISTLRHLGIWIGVVKSISTLDNLRELFMTDLTQHCLELICDNFPKLEALTLGNGRRLRQISGDKLSQLGKLRSFVIDNASSATRLATILVYSVQDRVKFGLAHRALGSSRATQPPAINFPIPFPTLFYFTETSYIPDKI